MNGLEPAIGSPLGTTLAPLTAHGAPTRLPLTVPQQKQLLRLINILGRAQEAQEAAQKHAETSQQNANDFLIYCAEEAGIILGQEGWRFDQGALAFVKEGPGEGAPSNNA